MKARSSVRWILVLGYSTIAALVVSLGFIAMRDRSQPEAVPTVHKRERLAERVASGSRRSPSSPWIDTSDAVPPSSDEMAPEEFDLEGEPEAQGPAWDPSWEANPPELRAAVGAELALVAEEREELLAAMTGGTDSDLEGARSVQRALDIAQVGLIPVYEGPQFVGLRVGSLPHDSDNFLSEIGVSSGDVITSINGHSVKDSSESPWLMLEELRSPNHVELTVVDSRGVESRHFTN